MATFASLMKAQVLRLFTKKQTPLPADPSLPKYNKLDYRKLAKIGKDLMSVEFRAHEQPQLSPSTIEIRSNRFYGCVGRLKKEAGGVHSKIMSALGNSLSSNGTTAFYSVMPPYLSAAPAMSVIGKIPEYAALKSQIQASDPNISINNQGELLNLMFTRAGRGLAGLKKISEHVNYGAYSLAVRDDKTLWLMRDNEDSQLHVFDGRELTGKIYYAETAEAFGSIPNGVLPTDIVIIEMPAYQVWRLELPKDSEEWNIRKFKLTKTKYIDWAKEEGDSKWSWETDTKDIPANL